MGKDKKKPVKKPTSENLTKQDLDDLRGVNRPVLTKHNGKYRNSSKRFFT